MATIYMDVKETAKLIRKELKRVCPGIKFSVRMSGGTGHGWLSCGWIDGPTRKRVQELLKQFENEHFDGMTDSTIQDGPTLVVGENGELEAIDYGLSGINCSREFSDGTVQRVRRFIEKWSGGRMPESGSFDLQDHGIFLHARILDFWKSPSERPLYAEYQRATSIRDAIYPLMVAMNFMPPKK